MIKALENIYSGPAEEGTGLPEGSLLFDYKGGFYHKAGGRLSAMQGVFDVRVSDNTPGSPDLWYQNLWIGPESGTNISTGFSCVGLGSYALNLNTTGLENVAVGTETLATNTTGSMNTAMGSAALYSMSNGLRNTAMGRQAGVWVGAGTSNTFLGSTAGFSKVGGGNLTAIDECVIIGSLANGTQGSTNEITIGVSASGAGSNSATLGNANITKTVLRGTINAAGLPTFANDGAASALNTGDMYKTATGEVRWKL